MRRKSASRYRRRIEVSRGFDADTLRRLVAVLERA